ncbi:hypothetical protein C8Q80DRAFT_1165816 [Daedaleopsis nitida]|nr:hypothetical protein C8Q80DRAFT_1165816 [Daedaleopsis nitida]
MEAVRGGSTSFLFVLFYHHRLKLAGLRDALLSLSFSSLLYHSLSHNLNISLPTRLDYRATERDLAETLRFPPVLQEHECIYAPTAIMLLVSPQTLATSTVPTVSLQLPKLDNTYGAVFLGTFLALILYGVAINQAFNYFSVHTSDAWHMKVYVCLLIAMDTFYTVASIHWLYIKLINDFFQPTTLLLVDIWSVKSLPITMGVTIGLCQAFLVYRIWRIDQRYRFFVVIVIFLMMAELGEAHRSVWLHCPRTANQPPRYRIRQRCNVQSVSRQFSQRFSLPVSTYFALTELSRSIS